MINKTKIHKKQLDYKVKKPLLMVFLTALFLINFSLINFSNVSLADHDSDGAYESECSSSGLITCTVPPDTRWIVSNPSQCPPASPIPCYYCPRCPPRMAPCPVCPPPLPPVCTPDDVTCSQTDYTHRDQIIDYIEDYWVPVFLPITEQLSAVMMQQAHIIGSFLDAKIQLETQAMLQGLETETHKRYRPDVEICKIGTSIRSLASSEQKYKINARQLSEIMMDRETLSVNGIGATGFSGDKSHRLEQFLRVFCDRNDNNTALGIICTGAVGAIRSNNDVNFTRTVDKRLTLDIDFTDSIRTDDEEDVIALSHYLFSHSIMKPIPEKVLLQEYAKDDIMDVRSVIALRGIARNSWGHIVGIKSSGTPEAAPFIQHIASQFGVPNFQLDAFIGENPSYFAQMNALTKKLFQSPEFYTNLYTTPANVDRTGVALQALKLMQDRDRFDSSLRREMLVSVMLELRLRDLQEELDNELLGLTTLYAVDPF